MKLFTAAGILGFFAFTTTSFAVGLSESDYAYLATQNIERTSAILRDLSPKEQAALHGLIADSRTMDDPAARAKSVIDALAIHEEHQLWDLPKR
jgi:hypothetical protein